MLAVRRTIRALATTRWTRVVALLAAGSVAASAAAAHAATFSPPTPVAGDTVTVDGIGSECYSGTGDTAVLTGKFERRNADGTYTTVSSAPAPSGHYSAPISQPGD